MGALGAAGSFFGTQEQANRDSEAAQTQEQAAQQVTNQANTAATSATGDVNAATGLGNATLAGGLQSQTAALSPYLQAGTTSLGQLQTDLTGLTSPGSQFNFNPATSPQLQFEQQQANQALQRQAAAQGTVLGGGTIRASDIMNTGLASTYTNQAFNQALAEYNTNRQNTLTQIQGLTNLTGLGYNATGLENQDIGSTAQQTSANTIGAGQYAGYNVLNAANIGEQATIAAANAKSANQIGQGKLWGGLTNSLFGTGAQLVGLGLGSSGGGGGFQSAADAGYDSGNSSTVAGTNDPGLFQPNYGPYT
jgi:hypothetical protein